MDRHRDNIGVLRLVLASLVVVGHSSVLIDGDSHREPFFWAFHTLSLGALAVDGFFLISGYLITMSWLRTGSLRHYLARRALRIYPAFILAYLLSAFAFGPFVGAQPWRWPWETALRLVALEPPKNYPGELQGLHYPLLDGAMWTIAFEFRCYLAVAVAGLIGALRMRWPVLLAAMAGLALMAASSFHAVQAPAERLAAAHRSLAFLFTHPDQPLAVIRLSTAFLVGMCVYLYRDAALPRLTGRNVAICGLAGAVLMFHDPHLAEVALVVLWGAVLFWLALRADLGPLQRINDRWDISYGVYLYGWPIATGLLWFDRSVSPLRLTAETLPLAFLAGATSWWGLERRTKDLARSWLAAPAVAPARPGAGGRRRLGGPDVAPGAGAGRVSTP